MGGRISVESELGRGSTFTFSIQAAEAELPPPARDLAPQLEGLRVLVVDDNATNRRILSLLAAKWGMAARETASPAEALRWVQGGEAFDLALLDYQMPGMDGVELAEALRLLRGRDDLRLVLLTSIGCRAAHTLKSTALNFGAEDLARHCREIEKQARSGDLEAARDDAGALDAEYQAVQAELVEMLGSYAPPDRAGPSG